MATTSQNGYLTSTDWNTFNNKEAALTKGNLTETTSSVLTITGGTGAIIGSGTTIRVKQATTSVSGYLSSTDWNTFNNKSTYSDPMTTRGDLVYRNSSNVTARLGRGTVNQVLVSNGTDVAWGAVPGAHNAVSLATSATTGGLSLSTQQISFQAATTSQNGYLTSTDWNTFNNKENALTKGNLTETISSVLTITGGTGAIIGSGTTIRVKAATTSVSGYLTSTDWNTFNSKENTLTFRYSLARSTNTINLTGDVSSPGNNKLYGTNSSGTRGWYDIPSGSSDHSSLSNRDVAGNHAKLIPASDSTTAIQLMKANGTTPILTVDSSNERVGINTTPTAALHLPAGTSTAGTAPLKLTAGTALGTTEDGALEYHSSHIYFTIGSTRYQLDRQTSAPVYSVITRTANYTTTYSQYIRCNSTSPITITLRSASGVTGYTEVIKNINTGVVTIATTSGQTIDGQSTITLYNQYDCLTVISNGSNWEII